MVAYALVRELPSIAMISVGGIVAIVLLTHSPSSAYESIAAAVIPAVIAALSRSQPADSWSPRRSQGATGSP
jgi:tetrahydromethanopterin S-methyltransferase subunit C